MHDIVNLEGQGVPSVVVATTEFRDGFHSQARELAMPDARAVFVEHPIQDRTDEEIVERAARAIDQILAALRDEAFTTP